MFPGTWPYFEKKFILKIVVLRFSYFKYLPSFFSVEDKLFSVYLFCLFVSVVVRIG